MKYDIVFEGGGAKGMVFVGALAEYVARGHEYGRLLGTSAGAIAATFVASGYTVDEMRAALEEKDAYGKPLFSSFMERPRPFTREETDISATRSALEQVDITALPNFIENRVDQLILGLMSRDPFINFFSLLERGGWYSADNFLAWMRVKMDEGRGYGMRMRFSDMNFQEFHAATGVELTLVAADTTSRSLLVLNHVTAPQCPVVWAVRMSMSLPLVWEEVVWQAEWGKYIGQDLTNHVIVDGGLLSNFPIELFISQDPYVVAMMGPSLSDGVLGMLIDETLPVTNETPAEAKAAGVTNLALPQRIMGLLETATQAHDKMVIDNFQQIVCHLPAKGYGTTEFGMSDKRREDLIVAGRNAMAGYFDVQMLESLAPEMEAMEQSMGHVDSLALNLLVPQP